MDPSTPSLLAMGGVFLHATPVKAVGVCSLLGGYLGEVCSRDAPRSTPTGQGALLSCLLFLLCPSMSKQSEPENPRTGPSLLSDRMILVLRCAFRDPAGVGAWTLGHNSWYGMYVHLR